MRKVVISVAGIIVLGVIGFLTWEIQEEVSPSPSFLNEIGTYYTVMVKEPQPIALTGHAGEKVREIILNTLDSVVADFKQENGLESLTEEDIRIQGLGENRKYVLGGEYDEYEGKNTTSYVYRIYTDTLGAHPNHFYLTFTFDQEGNEVALKDIFIPNSEYFTRLSQEAYTRVIEELGIVGEGEVYTEMTETVRKGTAPSPEALQFYYLTETDLHLLFPPYQVAAYAAGSFDIAIPITNLRDILKPAYQ